MSPAHRRFLFLDCVLVPALAAAGINASLAFFAYRNQPLIPLWGWQGVGADIALTSFFLPMLVCLPIASQAKKRLRSGRLQPLTLSTQPSLLQRLPNRGRRLALWLGTGCAATLFPLTVRLLWLGGFDELPRGQYAAWKGTLAGLVAAAVGLLVGYWAMAVRVDQASIADDRQRRS